MPLTVLSDKEISDLLHSLTKEDIERLQHNLAEALHSYSTRTQDETSACSQNQPLRTSITTHDATTLFMPARTESLTGVKVVTVGKSSSFSASASTPANLSTSTSTTSSSSDPPPNDIPTPQTQSQANTNTNTNKPSTKPTGTLTLLTATGAPHAFLSATTLTPFRTALASTLLLRKRRRVRTVLVLGAGAQAYWHLRLSLLLRGGEMEQVRIATRSFASSGSPLLACIYTDPRWSALRRANAKLGFSALGREHADYERLLKAYVRDADVLFGCSPATEPWFPAGYLTSPEGRRKGRYVCLVGSYRPEMREVEAEVLRCAVRETAAGTVHTHKHAGTGGAVVVDSLEGCLSEAGEVIEAGLGPEKLVELGELIVVRKAERREGTVVYKCVGIGVMDLCVGGDVVELARERGIGTTIEGF
ncbi:MAG: hypothetical protein LQ340_002844 [Diploschistes diacapsis]|nr:MAG: hypothetical protein LQ340_002844 [Diploschistes diacapsis]